MIDESLRSICILFHLYLIYLILRHTKQIYAKFIAFNFIISFTSAQFLVEVVSKIILFIFFN